MPVEVAVHTCPILASGGKNENCKGEIKDNWLARRVFSSVVLRTSTLPCRNCEKEMKRCQDTILEKESAFDYTGNLKFLFSLSMTNLFSLLIYFRATFEIFVEDLGGVAVFVASLADNLDVTRDESNVIRAGLSFPRFFLCFMSSETTLLAKIALQERAVFYSDFWAAVKVVPSTMLKKETCLEL